MKFEDLGLSEDILKALTRKGYTEPSPIQAEAIPAVLKGSSRNTRCHDRRIP